MKHITIALSIALILSACSERKAEKFKYNFGSSEQPVVEERNDALPLDINSANDDPLSEGNPSSYKYLLKNNVSSPQPRNYDGGVQSGRESAPKLEFIQPKNGESLKDSERYLSQFYNCTKIEAKKYARLNEPVEAIAKVSVSSCEELAYKAMKSNIYWLNSSASGKISAISQIKKNGESIALKAAMDARLQN